MAAAAVGRAIPSGAALAGGGRRLVELAQQQASETQAMALQPQEPHQTGRLLPVRAVHGAEAFHVRIAQLEEVAAAQVEHLGEGPPRRVVGVTHHIGVERRRWVHAQEAVEAAALHTP